MNFTSPPQVKQVTIQLNPPPASSSHPASHYRQIGPGRYSPMQTYVNKWRTSRSSEVRREARRRRRMLGKIGEEVEEEEGRCYVVGGEGGRGGLIPKLCLSDQRLETCRPSQATTACTPLLYPPLLSFPPLQPRPTASIKPVGGAATNRPQTKFSRQAPPCS